ncbi:MAG: hypothetical protein AB7K35_12940 [Pseudorhodoplanes sp.]
MQRAPGRIGRGGLDAAEALDMAMSTPSCASTRVIALPMPSLPPVTSAVLPFSCSSIFSSLF